MNKTTELTLVTETPVTDMVLNKGLAKRVLKQLERSLEENTGGDIAIKVYNLHDGWVLHTLLNRHTTWTASRSETFRFVQFLKRQIKAGFPGVLTISRARLRRLPVIMSSEKGHKVNAAA